LITVNILEVFFMFIFQAIVRVFKQIRIAFSIINIPRQHDLIRLIWTNFHRLYRLWSVRKRHVCDSASLFPNATSNDTILDCWKFVQQSNNDLE